jgi:hypothetical protein
MALTPNLTRAAIVSPGTQSIWTDNTVYGGANPLRNQVAVYLTAFKVSEAQVETPLTVAAFDPETVTTFTTTNGVDGWHKYKFVIINNWLVGTTYNKYDLVWDTTLNAFYEYINDTPSAGNAVTNLTYFSPVSDPTTKIANVGTATASGNLIYQVIDKVVSFQSSICYLKAASNHAIEICNNGECGCDTRIKKYFHWIRDLFALLAINETTGQFIEGERTARLLERYCDDCGCITR